jgi:hypothetical protein
MAGGQNLADSDTRTRNEELTHLFQRCTNGLFSTFRSPALKQELGLWHETNIRSAWLPGEVNPVFVD